MNTILPIHTSTVDPSSFIQVLSIPQPDGTTRILGFTPKGSVFEYKLQKNNNSPYWAWSQVGCDIWTR